MPSYLFIFDRRPEALQKSWDERITLETNREVFVFWGILLFQDDLRAVCMGWMLRLVVVRFYQ